MRLPASVWIVCALCLPVQAAPRFAFHVMGGDAGGWPELLSSMGLTNGTGGGASVIVAPPGTDLPYPEWSARVEQGAILILAGESPLATAFGFRAGAQPRVSTRSVEDLRAPDLRIVWEKALDLPVVEIPAEARVFARGALAESPAYRRLSQRCGRGAVGGRSTGPARL